MAVEPAALKLYPSMGPTLFNVGNIGADTETRPFKILQWGQRFSTLETDRYQLALVYPIAFNGANAFQRWKPLAL